MSDIAVIKFLFREPWTPLEDVVSAHQEDFKAVFNITTEKELVEKAFVSVPVIVLANVVTKDDLVQVINFLRSNRKKIRESNLKFSVINHLPKAKIETLLLKLGCQEILEPTIKSKQLKFKLDFWRKALKAGAEKALEVKTVTDKKKINETTDKKATAGSVVWSDCLSLKQDIWIAKETSGFKKVLSRWLAKFMAPSPFVCQWVEVSKQPRIWKLEFREQQGSAFDLVDGDWMFTSDQKPEFVWKENIWMFTGVEFDLYFETDGKKISRCKTTDREMNVPKNSQIALLKEEKIVATFDREIMVKMENQEVTGDEVETDGNRLSGSYSGKGHTEKTTNSPYAGKSSTDDLGAASYGGKSSTDKYGENPLAGTGGVADRYENYSGEASTDDVGGGDYQGKLANKANISKNKKHSDESNKSSDYNGDTATDDLGEDKLKGHLDYEQVEDHSAPFKPKASANADGRMAQMSDLLPEGDGHEGSVLEFSDSVVPKGEINNQLTPEEQKTSAFHDQVDHELKTEDASIVCYLRVLELDSDESIRYLCKIEDYFDGQVQIKGNANQLVVEQKCQLNVAFDYCGKSIKAGFKGCILELNPDEDDGHFIDFKLDEEARFQFEKLMKLYQLRQAHVSVFLKKAKGL